MSPETSSFHPLLGSAGGLGALQTIRTTKGQPGLVGHLVKDWTTTEKGRFEKINKVFNDNPCQTMELEQADLPIVKGKLPKASQEALPPAKQPIEEVASKQVDQEVAPKKKALTEAELKKGGGIIAEATAKAKIWEVFREPLEELKQAVAKAKAKDSQWEKHSEVEGIRDLLNKQITRLEAVARIWRVANTTKDPDSDEAFRQLVAIGQEMQSLGHACNKELLESNRSLITTHQGRGQVALANDFVNERIRQALWVRNNKPPMSANMKAEMERLAAICDRQQPRSAGKPESFGRLEAHDVAALPIIKKFPQDKQRMALGHISNKELEGRQFGPTGWFDGRMMWEYMRALSVLHPIRYGNVVRAQVEIGELVGDKRQNLQNSIDRIAADVQLDNTVPYALPLNLGLSHWTLIYFDTKTKTIEYYDSFGAKPNAKTQELLNGLKRKLGQDWTGPVLKVQQQIQHDSYQCGPYTLYFLQERLQHPNFSPQRQIAQEIGQFRKQVETNNIVIAQLERKRIEREEKAFLERFGTPELANEMRMLVRQAYYADDSWDNRAELRDTLEGKDLTPDMLEAFKDAYPFLQPYFQKKKC